MRSIAGNPDDVLLRRLSVVEPLEPADARLLGSLAWEIEEHPARHHIVREGDRPSRCCLLLDGVTCRFNDLVSGERQIQMLHIKGDMPDLLSLHLKVMDHGLITLSPCRLAFVTHTDLRRVCEASRALNSALWRETLIDSAMYRAAIIRLGRLAASEKLAHFLCEMALRFGAVAALDNNTFRLPVTQEVMGEVLGLTTVSVNRCIQGLRTDGLVRIDRGTIQILQWDRLAAHGQFDSTYLHLND